MSMTMCHVILPHRSGRHSCACRMSVSVTSCAMCSAASFLILSGRASRARAVRRVPCLSDPCAFSLSVSAPAARPRVSRVPFGGALAYDECYTAMLVERELCSQLGLCCRREQRAQPGDC